MISIIKTLIVSIYYVLFLTMDEWMNVFFVMSLVAAIAIGFGIAKQKKELVKYPWIILALGGIGLYIPITISVYQTGSLELSIVNGNLKWLYYLTASVFALLISHKQGVYLLDRKLGQDQENTVFFRRMKITLYGIMVASIIPIIMISPYVFARADDYSFGYHCRPAWEDTGSLIEVLKASIVMILEAYFDWQGTYSSIFMMSIQPAVFDERLYAIVPMFFVTIITVSSYFFLKTILIDWLKVDKTYSQICIWTYILLGMQTVPVIQSAFFWYNGAVHYIASHCMQLCMLAFFVRLCIGKRKWTDYLGCVLTAIYVGGGNLVTLIGTLYLTLSITLVIIVMKAWEKYKNILIMCVIYWLAMAVNLLAPGNYSRLAKAESLGLVGSLIQAFVKSSQYLFGKWMHWTLILGIIFLLPFLWKIVRELRFSFRYPILVLGYSWSYIASLVFSPLYGSGGMKAGRYENIIFLQSVLVLLFDVAYILGWMQRKYQLLEKKNFVKNEKTYLIKTIACVGVALLLCGVAEPTRYLTIGCIDTLRDQEALQEYEKDYWENVELFTSGNDNLVVNDLSSIPAFLEATESELWHSGVKPFYRFQGLEFK